MIMGYHWFLDLLLLVIGTVLLKVQAQVSITARHPNVKVKEGSNFTLTWDFYLPPGESLREIVFGLWEKGYTSSYFITVTLSRGAVQNPEMSNKHPSYVGRVKWVGDISRSYAAFRLSNIKLSDNKTYGCQLGIGGFGQTKDSKMTLIVEKSSLARRKSTIVSVPSARIGIVGQATEFKWIYQYDTSDTDVKAVQLSQRTNPQTKPRMLWKVQNKVHTTLPGYANRLFVSVDSKNQQNHRIKSYTFKLSNVTRTDEGDYEFKVEFTKKELNLESRVFLDVLVRPQIISSQQVTGIYKEGQRLLLACQSKETLTPKFGWIKNGRLMPHHTESFYLVNKLSISDAGVYSCCAYYPFGNVSSLGMRVRVQYAPRIISPSETRTVLSWKGNPTKLECIAVGDPAAKFSWTRADKKVLNGEFETSGNTSVLTIIPSAESDFSNYTCTSRNFIGEDNKAFILKPIRPPSPPTITNIVVNYNAIKVLWETPSTKQDTPITGHVLGIRKQGGLNEWIEVTFKSKSNYYILGNLTKETNYIVRLYATNVAGRSNASEEKQVKTLINGRPSLPRLHFKDVKINHTNFLVSWDFPGDDGGAEVNCFTVWYRAVVTNNTQDKWLTVNTTKNSYYLKLNCCMTYEIMVTAWNENGPSISDPDNAARITVLRDLPDNSTLNSNDPPVIESSHQEDTKVKVDLSYLPIVAVLIIPVLVCCLVKSRFCKKPSLNVVKINDVEDPEGEMEELVSSPPVPHVPLWEFPRLNLAVERVIGNGAFGVVSKAYARNLPDKPEWTTVAVKSVQDGATESERRDLVSELNLLKKLKPHPHIIRLLGCITTEQDGPFVIIEYVPYGDLLGYLRRSRGVTDCYYDDPEIKPTTDLTSDQMLKFAWQISDGMRYIASKKILHRDLAARNVLVGENHTCKITDFGMARDVNLEEIYVPRTEGRIPVKWTAIEAMTGAMKYSTQSDVWSFGVVLFEICTIGAEPYPGISPYKLPNVLLKGYRLPKPEYVEEELYSIMMECWETEPENRPSFNSLCNKIKRLGVQTNQNYVNIKDCLEAYENEPTETSCLNT